MRLPVGAGGEVHADAIAPLPARLDGEGIVVVSGITTDKTDAPFTLSLAPIADAADGGTDSGGAAHSGDSGVARRRRRRGARTRAPAPRSAAKF